MEPMKNRKSTSVTPAETTSNERLAPRRRPAQMRALQTVDLVLEAAASEIEREGLDKLTTKRIAAAAGLSVGALYEYFPNKQAVVHALDMQEPVVMVADRENGRLQMFDTEGRHLRTVTEGLRRPCNADVHGDLLAVADLNGCVALFDRAYKFLGRIGDQPDQKKWAGNGVPASDWKDGEFVAPHACRFDAAGNLYVTEWLAAGRVVKLRRVASPPSMPAPK